MDIAEYKALVEGTEMGMADHAFILNLLRETRPRKIVEVGVCAGGTTALLLSHLPPEAELHSVDIEERYARDSSQKTGYVAEKMYDPQQHARWETHFGVDLAECVNAIGHGIDFAILDTVHALPGEVLSWLAVFPFMKNGSLLVLHDISTHVIYKTRLAALEGWQHTQYCTPLLFSAIFSRHKFLSEEPLPNCGGILIDKAHALDHIHLVLNLLFIEWAYMPAAHILEATARIVEKYYPPECALLLREAVRYNTARLAAARS